MPTLFIVLLALVALLTGQLEFALYMTVTAFGLGATVIALWTQELRAMPNLRAALYRRGVTDPERMERALEQPSRWATYCVAMFFASGFVFAVYYLIPSGVLGGEAEPTFFLALYLFVLAIIYLFILFVCAARSRSVWAFDSAMAISRALWVGITLTPILVVMMSEAVPSSLLVGTLIVVFQTGLGSVSRSLLVFCVPETLGVIGCVVIVWQDLYYGKHHARRFSNEWLGVSVLLYLSPFVGYGVAFLLKG